MEQELVHLFRRNRRAHATRRCAARPVGYLRSVSDNVELVRRAVEVFVAGDLDRYFEEFVAPDVVWHTSAEDPDAATHEGREAFRRYIGRWMDSFEDLAGEVEEWLDAGDNRVFAWTRWTGHGRASGLDADWHLAIVYTVRDGRISGGEEYFDRDEGLEAAGLAGHRG
jgi:ketosteroid isomerase-like protein